MKAITILQPWAELIVSGQKPIENRTWATDYRGPLLIHAGKGRRYFEQCNDLRKRWALPLDDEFEWGSIVGVATLIDCVSLREAIEQFGHHEFAEGPVCWLLRAAKRLPTPIPWRGQMGIFDVPRECLPRSHSR